jgi:4-azaleucine resistance transporter AzlC
MSYTSTNTIKHSNQRGIKDGMITSIPIAIGYIPIAITFGIIAQTAGLNIFQAMSMSLIVFAGASQFVGVNLLTMGVPLTEIILTTFILNFRHFLMSSFLITKFEEMKKSLLAIVGFGITDETFSIASLQEGKLSAPFLLGLNFTAYTAWVGGTGIGVLLATGMPPVLQSSMGIALYAMFIGLLVPNMKKSLKVTIVALGAGFVNIILSNYLSIGWSIIAATIVGALLGSILFKGGTQ